MTSRSPHFISNLPQSGLLKNYISAVNNQAALFATSAGAGSLGGASLKTKHHGQKIDEQI